MTNAKLAKAIAKGTTPPKVATLKEEFALLLKKSTPFDKPAPKPTPKATPKPAPKPTPKRREVPANAFTIADLARELKVDPKIARAKLRRSKDAPATLHDDAWVYANSNRAKIVAIIKG